MKPLVCSRNSKQQVELDVDDAVSFTHIQMITGGAVMPQTNLAGASKAKESLEAEELFLPDELPFELVLRPNNKTSKLIANSGQNTQIKSQNRWYDFEFSEYVFLTSFEIAAAGFGDYHEFEFAYRTVEGQVVKVEKRISSGLVSQTVNAAITSVSFRPPATWLSDTSINSIKLIGLTQSDIESFLSTLERIDAYRGSAISDMEDAIENAQAENNRYVEIQAQLASLNNEIAKTKTEISSKKSEITKLGDKITNLKSDFSNNQNEITSSTESLNRVKSEIESKTSERDILNKETSDKSVELKALKEDINLFPSEISGFVGQGTFTVWVYVALSLVPILIIVTMFILLVEGAADLTTVLTEKPNSSVYAIFLTRIPYVAIAAMIIAASYKICRVLLAEVIRINQQKLNLTKISIIAKDVSFASETGLNLGDEEKYQLRTKLKMDLLRDHLKEYLSKDFSIILPHSINSLSSSLATLGLSRQRDNDAAPLGEEHLKE